MNVYSFNWQWAWNVGVFGLHSLLTGHGVFFDLDTGKLGCYGCGDCRPQENKTEAKK